MQSNLNKKLSFFDKDYIVGFVLFFLLSPPFYASSPDRAFVERKLYENRYILEFINVSVSNFGNESVQKDFHSVIIDHFKAYRLYLQGQYPESFIIVQNSQKKTRKIFHYILEKKYMVDLEKMLTLNAAGILRSKDRRAMHLLKLGYRDLKIAREKKVKALNFNKYLNSIRIYFYIDAIQYARQAKRYAFLALMESKIPLPEKKDLQRQTLDDHLNKKVKPKITDYEKILKELTSMVSRKLIVNNYDFFVHHDDNYGIIFREKKDYFKSFILNRISGDLDKEKPKVKLRALDQNQKIE